MSKRTRIVLIFGLLLIAALIFAATRSREPVYQGKKLSQWLEEITPESSESIREEPSPETKAAIRQIGTNAIPTLLSMIHSKDSRVKEKMEEWSNKQRVINIEFHHSYRDRAIATEAFHILGPISRPAIPALSRMLYDTDIGYGVSSALAGIGRESIPVLTNALNSTDGRVREFAIEGLLEMHTNAESVLPLLIKCLQDPNWEVRLYAVYSMFYVGTNQPAVAVPALINSIQDTDYRVRREVIKLLGEFGSKAQAAVPLLIGFLGEGGLHGASGPAAGALMNIIGTNQVVPLIVQALTNNDVRIQRHFIGILGTFKTEEHVVIPVLLPFTHDERLRRTAVAALIHTGYTAEDFLPILIKELSDVESPNRENVLRALKNAGPEAKAAVPLLQEQIKILNENHGQFPVPGRFIYSGYNFSLSDSDEFKTLRKIDPDAADKIKKQFEKEKAEAREIKK